MAPADHLLVGGLHLPTMLETLNKIWEWLKEPEKYLPPIAIACGVVLFYPPTIPDPIEIISLRSKFQAEFTVAFLLAVSGIIWRIVTVAWTFTRRRYQEHRWVSVGRRHLHELTPEEKRILGEYIEHQTIALDLSPQDGVVAELVHYRILRCAVCMGTTHSFSYNIQPWAIEYLNKHRELLYE